MKLADCLFVFGRDFIAWNVAKLEGGVEAILVCFSVCDAEASPRSEA
jgi:hypothetical protein